MGHQHGADRLQLMWWRKERSGISSLWLVPLAALYRVLWSLRSLLYRWRVYRSHRAPVPVVVVGNLVVGGAGKTPCTVALVQALQTQGWCPGVISRGYKGSAKKSQSVRHPDGTFYSADEVGDEPLLLARRLQVPVWIGANRIEAARALCHRHPEVNILVADDGLQHLALTRDAQIIVFDDRGIGNGRVLPAGPLRQPWTQHPPARSVVVYNGTHASTPWPGHLAGRRLGPLMRFVDWQSGRIDQGRPLSAWTTGPLQGTVDALAGIAAPQQFFHMLQDAGLVIHPHPRADHVRAEDMNWPAGDRPIIVTEKDAVKIAPEDPVTSRVWVATLDFDLPANALNAMLAMLPPRPPPPSPPSRTASDSDSTLLFGGSHGT